MNLVCPACGTTNRVSEERLDEKPVCGSCRAPLMAAEPVSLGDTTPTVVSRRDAVASAGRLLGRLVHVGSRVA